MIPGDVNITYIVKARQRSRALFLIYYILRQYRTTAV